ncbi:hypothetical protein D1007_50514 [Hordeum vulgare]|nr:hypothetical protein D1007_50514 [Hordeum vulgare]
MHADPQILEQLLAIEAIVDAPRTDAATRLAALNNNWLYFLEGSAGAFHDDYKLFSQHACAFVNSRAGSLVPGQDEATHHYKEGTHDVEASPSSKPIIIDSFDNKEWLVF